MSAISRRRFIKLLSGSALGWAGRGIGAGSYPAMPSTHSPIEQSGADLSGWEVVVGDGCWPPGAVTSDDIQTLPYTTFSELRANILHRNIAAHNITVLKVWRPDIFDYVHVCGYKFRMPYVPSTQDWELNAQTLEGGIFLWDGSNTRLAYGLGFSWMLNPWGTTDSQFGDLRGWTSTNGGQWVKIGVLTPDTQWHTIALALDCQSQTTSLTIDGQLYPSYLAGTPKPSDWTHSNVGLFQAEIINTWPGTPEMKALHKAEFKDWYWNWQPYRPYDSYLPLIRK